MYNNIARDQRDTTVGTLHKLRPVVDESIDSEIWVVGLVNFVFVN